MSSIELSSRDAKWDNVKCLLIFCVVIGHVLYRYIDNDHNARSIYFLIYTFHMPVFIFLSGMFSKKGIQNRQYYKILFYIMVYFVMKLLQAFAESLGSGEMSFRFFWESGPGWYALAMAVYYFLSFLIEQYLEGYDKKKLFLLSMVIGIFWGFDGHMGDHFCSARILNFYPFFVLGNCFESKQLICHMRERQNKLISVIILSVVGWISFSKVDKVYWMLKLLKGKYPFEDMGINDWSGAAVRLAYYFATLIIGWAVMTLIPEKETFFSYVGKRTLPIFIWHTFIIILILDVFNGQEIFQRAWPLHYVPGFIMFACVIVLVCSMSLFEKSVQCLVRICQVQTNI